MPVEVAAPGDAAPLRWSFLDSSYQIFYADENGGKHRTNKGLKVPRKDAQGRPLSGQACQRARCVAQRKARALWNERTSPLAHVTK